MTNNISSFLQYVHIADDKNKIKKPEEFLIPVLPISILWFFKKKKYKIHPS